MAQFQIFSEALGGLRQGDRLSTYLFVLAMEARSSLKRAKDGGYILGFRVSGRGGEGVEVSYLLFVDDTIAFCEPSQD